jgi:methyl-accepting chemotaxis protein
MTIGKKLLIAALAMGLIPFLIIGSIALFGGRYVLSHQAFSHLESVREIKKAQLENFFNEKQNDMQILLNMVATIQQNAFNKLQAVQENKKAQLEWYFRERLNNLSVLSKSQSVSRALEQFEIAFHSEEAEPSKNTWQTIEEKFGIEFKQFQREYGFDDLFLIGKDGDIVYTAAKRSDLGKNINDSALKESPLHKAFQKGLHKITLQDFEPYAPANNQYLAFMTAPIFHHEKTIGVLALSLSHDFINAIVQRRLGMGQTGETYVVGQLDGKTSYRSDRVVKSPDKHIIGYPKTGNDIDKALNGLTGIEIKVGSTGDLELGGYTPLQIPELKWCLMTTIALEELLTLKLMGESEDVFTKYINQYGFSDLFLIHQKGDIFYSVKREADYGTNLIHGEYANLQLGQLVQQVLKSQNYGISDYAPYAPSNNKPSAFIAQPVLHNDKVVLVVALQLDDTIMNQIMQQRAGMGLSGETYLVGSDKLMRSNSYLAPNTHSIEASFAVPEQGHVDTESSRQALAGQSGEHTITNYQGDKVLSAYTPVAVGDKNWALIAEIHQSEAFAPTKALEWLIGTIIFLSLPLLIGGALLITSSIILPLNQVVNIINHLAEGQLICWIDKSAKNERKRLSQKPDEFSQMLYTTLEMSDTLQNVLLDIQKTVSAAKRGDLSHQIDTHSLKGFSQELGDSTNQLMNTTSEFMEDVTRVMMALAQGCLNENIENHYEGIYADVSGLVQITIHNMQKVIVDIQKVVDSAGRGELNQQIYLPQTGGFGKELSHAINTLLEIQRNFSHDIGIFLENLKNGDLTQPIQTHYAGKFDEIKQNANSTISKLVSMLSEIQQIAIAVNHAAIEMEKGNNSLANRTETQAASLEETAAAMEQLTAVAEQNTIHAQTANQLAHSATQTADQGGIIVQDAVNTMQQVYDSSHKISEIITVINGIAFQTNILAINAAVEAAHAGEHGRGFAVVATEVRSLAQRCAESAKEIKELVENSVANIEIGTLLVEQAGNSMDNIIISIQRVTDIITEISAASREQSHGIQQINAAIAQMDNMTQQNATLVEQAAANAEGLAHQATKLTDAFRQFKLRRKEKGERRKETAF